MRGIDKNVGRGDGGGLIRTRLGGRGDVTESRVAWRYTKGMPSLAGALLYQNVLYVVRNAIITPRRSPEMARSIL